LRCAEMPAALVRQQLQHDNSCVREAAELHISLKSATTNDGWEATAYDVIQRKALLFISANDEPTPKTYPVYWAPPNIAFTVKGSLPIWLLQALLDHPYRLNQLATSLHPDAASLLSTEPQPTTVKEYAFPDGREYSFFRTAGEFIGHPRYVRAAEKEDSDATHLCQNPQTPPELLREMAASEYSLLRWLVAQNPALPPDLLRQLARDPVYAVRDGVINNPQCPAALVREICARALVADVPVATVLYRVLAFASPFVSSAFLERHAGAPDWLERYAIARNPQTPARTLAGLAEDGVWVVRMAARAQARA
jgi:hypothetical protein